LVNNYAVLIDRNWSAVVNRDWFFMQQRASFRQRQRSSATASVAVELGHATMREVLDECRNGGRQETPMWFHF